MPIYDQTYRRYEARQPLRKIRFWPITRESLRLILVKRAFLLLLAGSWLPFVFWLIWIYIATRFPEANRVIPADGRLFGQFLNGQTGVVLLLTVFGGAGLVANDLRTGAMLVYLSRPLTRRDYVAGKLGVLLALNLSATLVPGLLLYGIALALAPEQFFRWSLAWVGPAVVIQSLLLSFVVSVVALAISSLCRTARVAGLGFAGLFIGLETARGVLRTIFDAREATLLSLQANITAIGNLLFGIATRGAEVPWGYAALVLLAVSTGSLLILRSRVRAVEIVR